MLPVEQEHVFMRTKGCLLSPSLLGMSRLGFTEAAGLGTCFTPTGEVAVHDGIEGGTVVGHK